MIIYTTAQSEQDLQSILRLQQANLPSQLKPDEMASQGFVTVTHSLADLQKLNEIEPHIIAKEDDKVIGYLLAMTAKSKDDIPVLKPMFQLFDSIQFHSKPVAAFNYIVVGQVCVDKDYRGQGVLDNCYTVYKEAFGQKYDFAITEIAMKNSRSLNSHKRIGFVNSCTYTAPDKVEWQVVIWDWKL